MRNRKRLQTYLKQRYYFVFLRTAVTKHAGKEASLNMIYVLLVVNSSVSHVSTSISVKFPGTVKFMMLTIDHQYASFEVFTGQSYKFAPGCHEM